MDDNRNILLPMYETTELNHACARGDLEHVEFPVAKWSCYAGISVAGNDGNTPLHYACEGGNLEVVKFLIDSGADVSVAGNDGNTPLHYACEGGNLEVVKFLIDSGADVSALDKYGYSPLELLTSEHREEIEEYVSTRNFGVKPAKR
jgi:ankyrin repeat protein